MSLLRSFVVTALTAAVAATVSGQSARRPIELDDLARIRTVGDPQRSPEGTWVAYTVSTTNVEKDTRDTDVWMTSWDGGEHVQLTSSPDSESMPRWSPDGKYLAFLASRGDEDEKKKGAQVWLLNRAGGEAHVLTDVKGGISEYAWSPDGKRLALVVADVDPADDPEKMEGWKRKTEPPIVIDRYRFKQDREGYLRRLYTHLWLFDVAGRKGEPLTSGAYDDGAPAWSPDGRRLAFVSARTGDPDRSNNTDIFVIDASPGAQPTPLTTFSGADGGHPAWSPDGAWIAYLQGEEAKFDAYSQEKLAIVPSGGGTPRVLTAALDRTVDDPIVWSADGTHLFVPVIDNRAVYVGRVPVGGGVVEPVTSGRRTVTRLSAGSDGAFAVLAATPAELPEVAALERGQLRRLSRQNDGWLGQRTLGITEDFTSWSRDGTEVHGLMVKPAGYVPGRRYPTILNIHGGPKGQDDYAFSVDRELFAANGYVVLAINYRGSDGRGQAFQRSIYADWGNKEVVDLLGAVDRAVADGVADPDALGIGGWSYGGILTDATISKDTRFKAATSGAGVALQLAFYGVDHYIVQWDQEIGPPWKSLDTYLEMSSAFLHADRIRTPTLFMGGEKDFNVPLQGSEQMYQALKSLGVETQLVIYPGQFHGLTTPSYVRDRAERRLAWYAKYLKSPSSTTTGAAPR